MDRVWLNHYQDGVPHDINPNQYQSLNELFQISCQKFTKNTAISNLGVKLTYAQLNKSSQQFAAYLQNYLQLEKGSRVALMMPNLLQYPVACFGVLRAGLVVVNVNPLYTPDELTHQINDSGAETLIVLSNFADTVEKALPNMPNLKNIIVTQVGDLFPFPKNYIVNLVVKYVKKMVPAFNLPNSTKFSKALTYGRYLQLNPVDIKGDDTAFLQYTGGTTGVAKGAVLSHRNMVANLEQASAWIAPLLKEGKEIIITALPLYHIFSLTANLLTFTKYGGHNFLITNPRDIPHFLDEIKNAKFTAITGVNTLFNAMLHHAKFKEVDFSQLKLALGGGMAVQKAVADQWKKRTQSPLIEAYGLTETCPAVCINPMNQTDYNGSIGLPLPSTEVKICDEEGNELGMNQEGELLVRGPQVMQGYWNKPEETAKVLTEDGWLKTGDVAKVDNQGFVYLVDRIKDMIIVSGFNVYPNEVEQVLVHHPGISEAGVVGVPSEEAGEKVKAFIVRDDKKLSKADVIAHCREHLSSYKVPKEIVFCKDLPKTNVGKILRRKLKEVDIPE